MAEYMLYVGCHGIDDPNRAGLVFAAARGVMNNKEVNAFVGTKIALLADAVLLMKTRIAQNTIIAGPNRGSVADLIGQIKGSTEIWVWHSCATARGVEDSDVEGKGYMMEPEKFAELCFKAKHVVSL